MTTRKKTTESPEMSFVKIKSGKTRLLIPAKEMLAIEKTDQIKQIQSRNAITAIIEINKIEIPVFALDDELQFSAWQNINDSSCLCLDDGKNRIAIVCDEASVIDSVNLTFYDLPGCMKSKSSEKLVHNLALYGDAVFCNTDTASLAGSNKKIALSTEK